MKKLAKASTVLLILMLLASLSGALAQTTNPTWNTQTVDSLGILNNGGSSLVLDSKLKPHIAYSTITDLKYASWNGTTWNTQTIDQTGVFGHPSLALDKNGNPHISYNTINEDLKYASWNGSKWKIETIEKKYVNGLSSLALDEDGNPHISYCYYPSDFVTISVNPIVKYASRDGLGWNIQGIGFGQFSSLALDSGGNPHISYQDNFQHNNLMYASWNGTNWNNEIVVKNSGVDNSLALDSDGNPHISFYTLYVSRVLVGSDLKYANWNGTAWNVQTIDQTGLNYGETSLALDSAGNAHVTYHDGTYNALKYATWTGSKWNTQFVDQTNSSGLQSFLVLDSNGNPHISYFDTKAGELKYAFTLSTTKPSTTANEFGQWTIAGVIVAVGVIVVVLAVLLLQRKRRAKNQ